MPNHPPKLIPRGYLTRHVEGLRDIIEGGEVRVYRMKADGSKGELLGTQQAGVWDNFIGNRFGGKHGKVG